MQDSIKVTDVFLQNLKAYNDGFRMIINQGGTSSSKTFSIIQVLLMIAEYSKKKLLISIVSETLPHLKRGAMRDFFNIIDPVYNEADHDKTNNIYHWGKCDFEFFSVDDHSKLRGARRDILFINEANNVSKDAYDQLEVRTRRTVFIDFNPTQWFWAHEMEKDEGVKFIRSTYLDNPFVDQAVLRSIESRKTKDPNWWSIYGLGELGHIEGLVFSQFSQVDSFPDIPYWCGLDFGYTNDPTALVRIGVIGEDLYVDELVYRTGLKNPDISKLILSLVTEHTEVFADSAEPKSIDEIYGYGVNIHGVVKGKDSILNGIDVLHRYNLKVTKRSTNIIKELRNYSWTKDKDGRFLNKPIDLFNHSIDGLRYAAIMKLSVQIESGWVV